jgi:acetyl esterase/lipase
VIPETSEEQEDVLAALAASSGSTIASINYRFSPQYPWPNPLHDVLHGYDWVLENLLPERPALARIGVCGELVGGSLATTLALTECELGKSRIVAAAVNNPIADWVFPDDLPVGEPSQLPEPNAPEETSFPAGEDLMTWWSQQDAQQEQDASPKKSKKPPKPPPPTAWTSNSDNPVIPTLTLSGERDVLFRRLEHCFDRFASPIHFFRSPHGKLIYPQSDDVFASSSPTDLPRDPLDVESRMDLDHYESFSDKDGSPEVPTLVRCRAYARIYPSSSSNLSLPQWRVTAGTHSPLLDQARELSKMLRRGIARQTLRSRTSRVLWSDPNEKAKYEAYAESQVHLSSPEGVGLWTLPENQAWNTRLEQTGTWMRNILQQH